MMLIIRSLGLQDYLPIWRAMQRFTDLRNPNTLDEIWFLQHSLIYTQGMAGKPEHLLNTEDIPIIYVDRGGQVTYHGPGQLVIYFLLDVARRQLAPRQLVHLIEDFLIQLLARFDIQGVVQSHKPGVYVDGAKIASIGLRIRQGACYHGLALNVAMDLSPFSGINPCGYAGMQVVQMRDFQPEISLISVEHEAQQLCKGYFDA